MDIPIIKGAEGAKEQRKTRRAVLYGGIGADVGIRIAYRRG
jgi:hypothetical protein